MRKEQRLRRQIEERQKQWDLLSEKLARLEKDQILETTTTGKFRLEHEIADARGERAQLEQHLTGLEKQLETMHEANPVQEFLGNRSGGQRLFAFGVTLFLFISLVAFHLLQNRLPAFASYRLSEEILVIEIALALLAGFFLISYLRRDTTAMKVHPTSLEKEFPEKGYKQRLQSFCGVLLDDLNKIDRETNWSAEYFTPLDAEVEMQSGDKRLKKVTDLLSAIRSDRQSRVFLVLGDPGSGKSVALRKLCRDLLAEVDKTGKVPLYINLREWELAEKWTEARPPTVPELYGFVLKNLKERGDVFANDFLDRYFKPMFDYGRFFIVLDSFDEIPAVLDAETSSWLIDKLSEVIYKFLAGAHQSRGMLASRIFRKPTQNFQAKTTLEIRPFTEAKIIQTFEKSLLHDSAPLTRLLFKERQEFVPIARNPFTAALIVSYAKEHHNTLPQTQAELYSDYIIRRLNLCQDRMHKKRLTIDGIIRRATDIAYIMFTTPELGLEVSAETLKATFPQDSIEDEIAILTYGRLGRLGGGEERRFSFAHRRFQEYFVARRLLERPEGIAVEAIPTDSRWRDALVIYCEVAPEPEARKIAEFCWSEIKKIINENLNMSDPHYLRAIHCLRFLKDTFRSRLFCIALFRDNLADFIEQQIESGNLLAVKLAVEAVGLLEETRIDSAIVKALNLGDTWIAETALKACRHLSNLTSELEEKLKDYIGKISISEFFHRRKELLFSLSLSERFSFLKKFCKIRIVHAYLNFLGILWAFLILVMIHPLLLLIALLYIIMIKIVVYPLGVIMSKIDLKISLFTKIWRSLFVFYQKPKIGVMELINIVLVIFLIIPIGLIILFIENLENYKLISHKFAYSLIFYYDGTKSFLWGYYFLLAIAFFSFVFLIPWYHIFRLQSLFKVLLKNSEAIKWWFLSFGGLTGLLTLMAFMSYLERNETFSIPLWILSSLIITFGILLLFLFLKSIYLLFKDYKQFKKYPNLSRFNRESISKQFNQFKSSWGRLKYVQRLQKESIIVEGAWPDGKLPNINNDAASTLLAQLEEKWLGLDR